MTYDELYDEKPSVATATQSPVIRTRCTTWIRGQQCGNDARPGRDKCWFHAPKCDDRNRIERSTFLITYYAEDHLPWYVSLRTYEDGMPIAGATLAKCRDSAVATSIVDRYVFAAENCGACSGHPDTIIHVCTVDDVFGPFLSTPDA